MIQLPAKVLFVSMAAVSPIKRSSRCMMKTRWDYIVVVEGDEMAVGSASVVRVEVEGAVVAVVEVMLITTATLEEGKVKAVAANEVNSKMVLKFCLSTITMTRMILRVKRVSLMMPMRRSKRMTSMMR